MEGVGLALGVEDGAAMLGGGEGNESWRAMRLTGDPRKERSGVGGVDGEEKSERPGGSGTAQSAEETGGKGAGGRRE